MKLTNNFSLSEFECKCGDCQISPTVLSNLKKVATQLQILRESIGLPISINSGYRCLSHNKAIGGVKFSKHTLGMAADIRVDEMLPNELAEAIEILFDWDSIIVGGIGIYQRKGFVHFDIFQPGTKDVGGCNSIVFLFTNTSPS